QPSSIHLLLPHHPRRPTPFPYTTLFRSLILVLFAAALVAMPGTAGDRPKFFGNYEGKAFDGENKMLWILGRRQDGSTTVNIVIRDRKSTRLNFSHSQISYAVFCLKKKIR